MVTTNHYCHLLPVHWTKTGAVWDKKQTEYHKLWKIAVAAGQEKQINYLKQQYTDIKWGKVRILFKKM